MYIKGKNLQIQYYFNLTKQIFCRIQAKFSVITSHFLVHLAQFFDAQK
ncbi:hypothetical protein NT05HA_2291 [Aggregatibacter aphrophilus NJ8700]|jgi:hypothetical protein|nr:hypothetical protein NT05HA_2291 [Aggregatibacter aphrophilus NJ8700]